MRTVLVVDDNEKIRFLLKKEFEEEGYSIVTAQNGKEAIDKISEELPDLVVLDIRMPGMDGIEALYKILSKDKKMPVIFYSSYPEYHANFMSWAAEAYVTKSSDLYELKSKVREILELHEEPLKI